MQEIYQFNTKFLILSKGCNSVNINFIYIKKPAMSPQHLYIKFEKDPLNTVEEVYYRNYTPIEQEGAPNNYV